MSDLRAKVQAIRDGIYEGRILGGDLTEVALALDVALTTPEPSAPGDLREQIAGALYHYDYIDGTPGTARDCQGAAVAVMDVLRRNGVIDG